MRKIKTWSQSVKVILVLVPAPCWPGWGWRQRCCAWASTFSQMAAAAPLLVKRLLVTLKIIWRSRVCILYKAVSHLHTFQNVLLQIIGNQSPWPVKLVRRLGVFSEDSSLAQCPPPHSRNSPLPWLWHWTAFAILANSTFLLQGPFKERQIDQHLQSSMSLVLFVC